MKRRPKEAGLRRVEYQGRFFSVLVVVERGQLAGSRLAILYRPSAKRDHELRRDLWRKSVEAIKREPLEGTHCG